MGTGLPSGLVRAEELVELVDGGAVPARGGDDPASLPSGVRHVRGQGIVSVDRLLGFRKQDPYETTADLAEHLADSLRQAAGSEGAWEDARRKVHVFCPDGAADEQLAGRLSSEFFPNLFFVLRCAAHSVHGCLRDAWRADTEVQRLTKNVVEEVAKFLRHSPRFQLRFGARQQGEIMEAVQNFNFAPQRFGSRAGSLGRFVLFIRPVMEVLADEVENPSSAARRAWALRIVHEMTSDNLHLLGMLADFAADCVSFLRRFDRRDIDPFSSAMAVQGYLTFLKRAYQQHQMWRTPGTFAKHIATILAEGGVLVVRDDTLVLEKPNREAQIRSMARLGNVAEAFVACLKAEFPRFSVQRLLGCFLVPSGVGPGDESAGGVGPGGGPPGAGGPAPTAVNQLRRLARYLQMDPAREEQLVAEFRTYYPRVVRRCASGECAPRDAWALELAAPANENELRPILRMMIGFFVSETECERLFSVENRRKASPMKSSARADILKIKTDGLPLSSLVIGGRPVGGFWFRAQAKYAELHGTRVMKRPIKEYETKGKKMGNRDERSTVTSFARKRLKAVEAIFAGNSAGGGADPAGGGVDLAHPLSVASVFSDAPFDLARIILTQDELKAEQDAFQKVYDKATQKQTKKEATAMALHRREPGAKRWSAPTRAQVAKAKQKRAALRAKLSRCCFRNLAANRLSWGAYVQRVGRPLFFCTDASHLEGNALAELYGGQPLSFYCFAGSLADYVMHPERYAERVILVPSLVAVAPAVRVAAVLMGARLQTQACVPALHFWCLSRTLCGHGQQGSAGLTIACTREFAQAEKEVVAVGRAAGACPVWGVRWVTLDAFRAAAPRKALRSTERRRFTLLCLSIDDASLPRRCRHVARTVREFVTLAKHRFGGNAARRH